MKPRNSLLKLVGYNLLVLFVLTNLLYWAIPTVDLISKVVGREQATSSDYRSFIGWRQRPSESPGVHVDGGPYPRRRTINTRAGDGRVVYFFGGSTMWGLGVRDGETIPSQFAALAGVYAENYGEIGYTAHQGLVLLLQLLQAGHRPDLVVFYDGANDVAAKCQRGFTPQSDGRERDVRSVLEGRDHPSSFTYFLRPVMRVAERIRRNVATVTGGTYDCDRDRGKAEAVAAALVSDWEFAGLLVEAFGGRFVGILQPVSFVGHPRTDGLESDPTLGRQFRVVYPLIHEALSTRQGMFDLTAIFDAEVRFYTDYNHLTPAGNGVVAEQVLLRIRP